MSADVQGITTRVEREAELLARIREEIGAVIVGQRELVDRLLLTLLANQHVLIEGVPGLAKTLSVTTLAQVIQASFQRIQFTPDLLPADLIGTLIYSPKDGDFSTKKGPIFANIVLADEINRAPAKVQSALLEAMQERQVTIGDETYRLPEPFMVLATQNPIDQEGTYPLPEAQVDRFMLFIKVGYPTREEERIIMDRQTSGQKVDLQSVASPEDIERARGVVRDVYIDDKIKDYIIDIVFATREPASFGLKELTDLIEYGGSPRASIYLNHAARAHAFLRHRGYVTPEDVKAVAPDVLRHRVIVTYEAEAEEMTSDDILGRILDEIEIP